MQAGKKKSGKVDFPNEFGLSFAYCPDNTSTLLDGIDRNFFHGVEINGAQLEDEKILARLKAEGFAIFNVKDPLAPSLTRSIAEQPLNMVSKFESSLDSILVRINALPCKNISLDFSLDIALANNDNREKVVKLIKRIIPCLYRNNINLCIPTRIPVQTALTPHSYLNFLKDTMFSGIHFSADIYPHEITKSSSFFDAIRWFRFNMNMVRFIYEPENGNLIVPKMLETWLETLRLIHYEGPILFCPKITNISLFSREGTRIADMLSGLSK